MPEITWWYIGRGAVKHARWDADRSNGVCGVKPLPHDRTGWRRTPYLLDRLPECHRCVKLLACEQAVPAR